MSNGGFSMDTDLVNNSGSSINESGTTFQENVKSFKNHTAAILNIWTGDDATEFEKVANEVAALLDKASVTVQEVGTHLVNTAVAVNDAVAENKTRISSIG